MMINFVIAFDNQDATLGQYFEDCKNDIVNFLEEQEHMEYFTIPSHRCNVAYIDMTIPQNNPNPFVFIAYTHGDDGGLTCSGDFFVFKDNCLHFSNSLFYSTACLIGKRLAPALIKSGCKTFVGFNEEIRVLHEKPSYRDIFIKCDNFALKMFLTSEATVGQAFQAMKNNYTNKIDRADELGEDFVFISFLRESRDALVCLGNKNLKKEELFV